MKLVNKFRKGQVTILGKAIPIFALIALMGMGTAAAVTGFLLLTSTSNVTITESITLYYWNGASWTSFGTLPQVVTLGPLNLYPGETKTDYFAASNLGSNPIIITMDMTAEDVPGFTASLVCDDSTGAGSGVQYVQDTTPGIWHVLIPGASGTKSIGVYNVVSIDAAPVSGDTFNSYTYRGQITVTAFNAMSPTTCP